MKEIKNVVLNFLSFSSTDHSFEELDDALKKYFKKRIFLALLTVIVSAIVALISKSLLLFGFGVFLSLCILFMEMAEAQDCFKGNINSFQGIVDSIENSSKIKRHYILLKHESGIFIKVYIPKSFSARKNYEVVVYADKNSVISENDNTILITNPLVINVTKSSEDVSTPLNDNEDDEE